jgi:hypothetical protein
MIVVGHRFSLSEPFGEKAERTTHWGGGTSGAKQRSIQWFL